MAQSFVSQKYDETSLSNSDTYVATRTKSDYLRPQFYSHNKYICIVLTFQLSLVHILQFTRFSIDFVGMSFIVPYLILYTTISLPLMLSQLLLGQYAKVGQFNVWRIAPIAYGIGYTMVMLANLKATIDCPLAAYALSYIVKSCEDPLPWKDCTFKNADKNVCIDAKTKINASHFTKPCCIYGKYTDCQNFTLDIAGFHYWRRGMNKNEGTGHSWDGADEINWNIFLDVIVIWAVIFIVVFRGFSKFKKIIIYPISFLLFFICIFFIVSLFEHGASLGLKSLLNFQLSQCFSSEVWLTVFTHLIMSQQLANGALILFSSYVSGNSRPDRDTLVIGGVKFIVTLFWAILFFNIYGMVATAYNMEDIFCITIAGNGILFGLVPEMFTVMEYPQFIGFLYFLNVGLLEIMFVILQMLAVVEAIQEVIPSSRAYHFCLVSTLCTVNVLLELPLISRAGTNITTFLKDFPEKECAVIVTLLYSIVVFYMYGVQRLVDDMEFMLGIQLSMFWKVLWFLNPILVMTMSIFVFLDIIQKGSSDQQSNKMTVNIIIVLLVISPIIIVAMIMFLRYLKDNNVSGLVRPERSWGSQDPERRHARKRFNPRKAIKYKEVHLKCKHKCLLSSKYLKAEEDQIEIRRRIFEINSQNVSAEG